MLLVRPTSVGCLGSAGAPGLGSAMQIWGQEQPGWNQLWLPWGRLGWMSQVILCTVAPWCSWPLSPWALSVPDVSL